MSPIPNPEDGGPVPPGSTRRYVRHAAAVPPPAARVRVHHRLRRSHAAVTAVRRAPATHAHPVAPPPRRPTAPAGRPAATSTSHAARPAPIKPAPAKPAAAHHERRATPTELRQAKGARHAAASNTTAASAPANATGADADARTEALRSALSAAVAKGAVLSAPKAAADGASEATLTLPAGFYDTVKTEAGRQAMGDAAASANADATLTGEGYAIIPGGAQSQPLRAGQPTLFRWTVTAPAGAKGPLRADVKVDLLGGGSQTLALGAVDQASAPGGGFRWWGAALLLAVVALGLWWMLRTRSADARIAASRKRARRPDGVINGHRPLDMRPNDTDPPLR